MPIRQLAPDVAAKIAAGEVVERPASVVKELIENSIDAGATQLRVDLMNGGLQLIRVTDNGSGIPVDELQLALARHATSKVTQIDDLEHIRSLGFRGEALASIAAVAEVTLLSRHRGAKQGAQVSAVNGYISAESAAASPEGTTLTVRNLFSAIPARLKFLKSRHTEISHCLHMLEQYALAYPEIRFSVFSDGRQIFATPGDGQLTSVLIEIYGLQVAEQMVPISSLDGDGRDEDIERPVVSGYTSLPACYKSTRQHISFFVNRRWVLSRMLTTAVEEAYHSLLLPGRHPIAVVNIALDPTLLDVNVHPAKTEIRFLKERRVYAAVLRAVRRALLEDAEMPTWSNGNKAATGKQVDKDKEVGVDEQEVDNREDASPVWEISDAPNDTIFNNDAPTSTFPQDNPWLTVTEEETGTKPPLLSRLWQSHVRKDENLTSTKGITTSSDVSQNQPVDPASTKGVTTDLDVSPNQNVVASLVEAREGELQQQSLTSQPARRLPSLRVVGQLAQSYIITEGSEGMYLIDQHAAHERILLERMVVALKARTPLSQMLLTPMQLELASKEVEAIEEHRSQLEQIGFSLDILDNNILMVRAVPTVLIKQMNARSLHELLTDLTAPEHGGHSETWEEHALANVACKAAIKANYFLTVSEMREMIEQLERTDAPYSCCHGRPTMIHFSLSALEREFGRR
ncbi:MAG: DNA mismatch repair endonuclease MutL [Ktedonobacteraceae bacterium]